MDRKNKLKRTFQPYIIFIFILVVISLFLHIQLLNKENTTPLITPSILDTIKTDTIVPSSNKGKKDINIQDSIRNTTHLDDEILKAVELALNYLSNDSKKSPDILNYHETKIKKLYRIKGLTPENNHLLSLALKKIRMEKKKITEKDSLAIIEHRDSI